MFRWGLPLTRRALVCTGVLRRGRYRNFPSKTTFCNFAWKAEGLEADTHDRGETLIVGDKHAHFVVKR
jgi:hypothetical protein